MTSTEPDGTQEASRNSANGGKVDRKGGLSCAECRRSKLKCDRLVPCGACQRRNCADICPNGTLAATKGNKVLQSQNQALKQFVKSLNNRVGELESALGSLQAQVSPLPHPLLKEPARFQDTEDIAALLDEAPETTPEELDEAEELIGSLSIGDQGQTRYHGLTSSSEYLQTLLPGASNIDHTFLDPDNLHKLGLPTHLFDLVSAFPFGSVTPIPDAKRLIIDDLPAHTSALKLVLVYFENLGFLSEVVTQNDFLPSTLHTLYDISRGAAHVDSIHPHQLAVIYLVLAIGSHLGEDDAGKVTGQKYYALACAALSLIPIVKSANSMTLQALYIMIQYFNLVDRATSERRWLLSGMLIRLAYSIGLQRDPGVYGLSAEETQRRRILFWEMFSWDAWHSITYGRPPAMDVRFTDCRFPEDTSPGLTATGEKAWGFHAFRYRFAAFCLSQVSQHIFNAHHQDYAALLAIDVKFRKFQIPSTLTCPISGNGESVDGRSWSDDPASAMQQYYVLCTKESTLLYIHRKYFAGAIRLNQAEPVNSKYGPSVITTFRSACLLLSGLRSLHGRYPKCAEKQCYFWSSAFSACIVLGCLAFNCPSSKLSEVAVTTLEQGVDLYSGHIAEDGCASHSFELLSRLAKKARHAVEDFLENARLPVLDADPDCQTMRVLEGRRVLVNNTRTVPSSTSSSTRSESPNASVERNAPSLTQSVDSTPSNGSNWSGDAGLPMTDTDPMMGMAHLYDFSGAYPLSNPEVNDIAWNPTIHVADEASHSSQHDPVFGFIDNSTLKPTNGRIARPGVPQFTRNVNAMPFQNRFGQASNGYSEDILMVPEDIPVVTQQMFMNGMAQQMPMDAGAPEGLPGGFLLPNANAQDTETWERFLNELGISTQ